MNGFVGMYLLKIKYLSGMAMVEALNTEDSVNIAWWDIWERFQKVFFVLGENNDFL